MYPYKNKNGLTVDLNFNVNIAKEKEFPFYITGKDNRCIELTKEDAIWLSQALAIIVNDLYPTIKELTPESMKSTMEFKRKAQLRD